MIAHPRSPSRRPRPHGNLRCHLYLVERCGDRCRLVHAWLMSIWDHALTHLRPSPTKQPPQCRKRPKRNRTREVRQEASLSDLLHLQDLFSCRNQPISWGLHLFPAVLSFQCPASFACMPDVSLRQHENHQTSHAQMGYFCHKSSMSRWCRLHGLGQENRKINIACPTSRE